MERKKKYIKDLVSVVIPTYKRFDTLSRAIKSVHLQTYSSIEILVVDDNEPGDEYSKGVSELIESLHYDNLLLIKQKKHINGAAARDCGINAAKGEYIAFLDDDDIWLPEKVEKEMAYLSSMKSQVGAISSRKVFYKNGIIDHVSEYWQADQLQNFKVMSKQLNIQTCTLLIKRSCLDDTGYFDPKLRRHQEVQLMTFFTNKYRVEFFDEYLTVIDSSDVMNRPNWEKLLEFKNDYFNSIKPILSTYSKHKQKLVYAHNMTEVAYAMFRDGKRIKGIVTLLKCFIYPSVLISFIKRFLFKKKSREVVEYLGEEKMRNIYKYINETLSEG